MCLWLLTACLGLLPANPSQVPIVVVQGVPAPILQPTTAAPPPPTGPTMTPRPPPANMTGPPPPGNMTNPPPPPGNMTSPPPAMGNMTRPPPPGNMTGPPPGNISTLPPMTKSDLLPLEATMPPNLINSSNINHIPDSASIGDGLSVILCNNADVVCISNPYETITGAPMIDPRLGTTPGAFEALQGPPVSGYNGQIIPSFDTAVRFPRQKRSVTGKRISIKQYLMNLKYKSPVVNDKHEIKKRQSCQCVPAGTCPAPNYGAGMIDIRIVTPGASSCPAGQVYCCTGQTTIGCGTIQTVPAPAIAPANGQADYGEYPWQAIILTKQNDYVAGGVLVDAQNVLTVTHRLVSYVVSGTAPNLKVRLGEWDAAGTYEPVPFQEYTVKRVFTHPSFVATTLQNDITVLRLSQPVPFTPAVGAAVTINRACLPAAANTMFNGKRCRVAGWGKDMFGVLGEYQEIIKKVEVPIVDSATCQTQLRAARLGPNYILDPSFICAGGEVDKDACTGDGGSGLVCEIDKKWTLVGLVAWGLGCASANVPGVYVNIAGLLPWIQQQIATAA